MTRQPSKLAYILGTQRSGSTLTDLLLNNHPKVQTTGEFHRISMYIRDGLEPFTCGQAVQECPFWLSVEAAARRSTPCRDGELLLASLDPMLYPKNVSRVREAFQKALLLLGIRPLYEEFIPFIVPPHYKAIQNSLFWYGKIAQVAGASVVLDSTKDPRRMKMLYMHDAKRVRIIHTLRDGRGVAASKMRREGVTMDMAASAFKFQAGRALLAARTVSHQHLLRVRYEDLCRNPEKTVRGLCGFLGLDFFPEMLAI